MEANNSLIFFSCIVTCFNRAGTIKATIESILVQSYSNFEIIVIDDASTDSSTSKILEISDSRIRLIKSKINSGQNASLNLGVQAAKYDYLAFLDSDDTWETDYLKEMAKIYSNFPEVGFSYCNLINGPNWNLEGTDQYANVLNQGYLSSMITITAKKDAVNAVGNFDIRYTICQDDDFCFRLAKKYSFKVIKNQLSRIHGAENSMTKNKLNVAKGWGILFKNYKNDILSFCGSKTYSKHLLNVANQYLEINHFSIAIRYQLLAIYYYMKPCKNNFQFMFKSFARININITKTIYTNKNPFRKMRGN